METLRFDSGVLGNRLVVFGAIHGNEVCGSLAIQKIAKEFQDGLLRPIRGAVCFIPRCNVRAFEQGVRQTEENLNRVFRKTNEPRTYEACIANELCALLDTEADMLLDIHSTSAPGPMSVFVDYPTEANEAFARALGPKYILLDWPLVYANSPDFESHCTADYAHEIGIASVTVECGQHAEPDTIVCAELAIRRALIHAGIIDKREEEGPRDIPHRVRMCHLEKKAAEGDTFSKKWQHLEPLSVGSLIATREDGTELRAKEDCLMLLPKHHAKAGEEWFYTGILES